jgi:hypothetical protein
MGYYDLFDYANCKHFRFAQRVIDSRINTKVHCYFEFCKTYLIFFFFDESEVVYILPLLEYACELWDGCTQQEYNKIEQIQHEAARIITGLPKFSSLESLYFETGWEPLHSRRRRRKLNMFYKIRNSNAPSYLCDCLLPFERNVDLCLSLVCRT